MSNDQTGVPLKIGIVGAGFSGTALAATFVRLAKRPLQVYLFEKDKFAQGEAYSTTFPFHWLNVRARDMSAYEDLPNHFVDWLNRQPDLTPYLSSDLPIPDQFVSRVLYGVYLKELLDQAEQTQGVAKLVKVNDEVTAITSLPNQKIMLSVKSSADVEVDKVILAFGNHAPSSFKFPIHTSITAINDPWNYDLINAIPKTDGVAIVGTGLSMIDATLLLHHHQHTGPIYAISRRGLLPLPHTDAHDDVVYNLPADIPTRLRPLIKWLRHQMTVHESRGGDWRSVVTAVRHHIPAIWAGFTLTDRKQFLRHVLSYWNVHRHRVHPAIAALLSALLEKGQLHLLAGHVLGTDESGVVVQIRGEQGKQHLPVKWLINCMGPSLNITSVDQSLIQSILANGLLVDPLNLGFSVTAEGALQTANQHSSASLYTLGPPAKSATWECNAVPEIRKQVMSLVRSISE